jgi:MoaA/NifB/PqqE/SkfB family radical SAM enzyme
MNIPHDKFCILPWVSLETSPIGTVRPCCLAEEEIKDELGNKYKLISTDLRVIHNSEYMRNLRQQFLAGKQPQTCRKCWNEERSGRTSKRMHTLNRLKHIVPYTEWTADAKPLMFLDLKLGNICNLKCRICGSWSSSQFAAEEIKFEGKDNIHYQMLRDGAWPRENHGFWQDVDTLLEDIRYIEFTGGEPFMISEHFDLLQGIVDRGIAHRVEIHYNTNGTHYPEHAESVWQHFKTVEIAFSIDDVGARFEYQRMNAVWTEVNENIARFRELRSRSSNIQLQVCSTVNVFNVLYLEDLALWIDLQDFDYIYWNMLHEAYYLSVSTMPDAAKQLAIARLSSADVDEPHRTEFDRIVDFIGNGVSLDGNILRMKVRDLDWRRQQNLFDDHSELANAIGYEGPI